MAPRVRFLMRESSAVAASWTHSGSPAQNSPLDGPGHGQGELVQAEDLAQILPAGRADGPQRVTAALQLRYRHVLVAVGLQELERALGTSRG